MPSIVMLIIELFMLSIVKSIGIVNIDNILASILIILFTISFLISIQNNMILEKYGKQLFVGYMFRVFLLYFDLFGKRIRALPQSGGDTESFYWNAANAVLYGKPNRSNQFIVLITKLFSVIGINRLYGQFLLMLFSIVTIIIFVYIIESLKLDSVIKENITWIICLLPNFALLSSVFLRESIITMLITASLYVMIKWVRNGSSIYFITAIAISTVACLYHSGCIGIIIGCIICLMLYNPYSGKTQTTISGIILAIVFAIVVSFVFLQYSDDLMMKFSKVGSIEDVANVNRMGGSTYAQYVGDSSNPFNMIVYTLPRIFYFLFSPFPWQWRGIADIIAFFFSGLFYFVTIVKVIVYLKNKESLYRGIIICLLIIAFFCTFIFAWGVSNTGTASRHRDKMVCLYGIINALTTNVSKQRQEEKYSKLKSQDVVAEQSSYLATKEYRYENQTL